MKRQAANPNCEAYRGYLIRVHPMSGDTWIEKGGQHIGYAADKDAARKSIDELTRRD